MLNPLKSFLLGGFVLVCVSQSLPSYANHVDNKKKNAIESKEVRVKDLGKLQGWRDNALVGYGIVTGLAGTGDSPSSRTTRQALANVYSQFELTIPAEQIQSRNVAVVLVSATLPPFAREGDNIDVVVNSAGDARSLVGGSLLLTPLKATNGRTYALAQGSLSVGGFRYDANGNVIQKNHPTVGSVPNGATVEISVTSQVVDENHKLTFVLAEPDYTTASRIAKVVNQKFGLDIAQAGDASGVQIKVSNEQELQLVDFIADLENLVVEPDRRAKVVINERTGVVVAGGDVQISKVVISHGDLKISVANHQSVSQPFVIGQGASRVQTAFVTNTKLDVDEKSGNGVATGSSTVSDLVQSLAKLKMSTRDVVSILRAMKAAGALHAELIVQ
ncbi:flagellar basal body P-ring protein FlgI [Undibacterium sp. LX15W]|uniref:Flagellar P-ring protein n=2 Tax=Undibacterium flavidum TaxID=2762297 RepID=A0ABR6YES8_9BURK|nr:flagellar basal body P-ring protein FlgI [Undibacterium flavidum]